MFSMYKTDTFQSQYRYTKAECLEEFANFLNNKYITYDITIIDIDKTWERMDETCETPLRLVATLLYHSK